LIGHIESLFALCCRGKTITLFAFAHQMHNAFAGVPQIKHNDLSNLYALPNQLRINHHDLA